MNSISQAPLKGPAEIIFLLLTHFLLAMIHCICVSRLDTPNCGARASVIDQSLASGLEQLLRSML